MTTAFPAAIDDFTTIPAGSTQGVAVGARTHRQFHNDTDDAIEAIEAKLGTGVSTPTTGSIYGATGTGTAGYRKLATADITAGAVDQTAIAANAVTQRPAMGTGATNPTLTSGAGTTAFADPTVNITTTGGDLDVDCAMNAECTTVGAIIGFYVKLDAGAFQQIGQTVIVSASQHRPTIAGFWRFTGVSGSVASPAAHTITLGWSTNASTATGYAAGRFLRVTEIKK